MTEQTKRIDRERLQDITAVILWVENRVKTQDEVLKWFELNFQDCIIHARLYYAYKNAGLGNPMKIPIENIDVSLLDSA